jgi:hypothetical protein
VEVSGQLQALAAITPPEEKATVTQWIGGWVGPRVGLDAVERRKILHYRELNPGHPASKPSVYRLSYPNSKTLSVVILYSVEL